MVGLYCWLRVCDDGGYPKRWFRRGPNGQEERSDLWAGDTRTSTPYVGHLEFGKRHPSHEVLRRLAEVLRLDRRDLFFLANPGAVELLKSKETPSKRSAWDEFRKDHRLRRMHNIGQEEMNVLAQVASLGEVGTPRDFIYILNAVRHALGR